MSGSDQDSGNHPFTFDWKAFEKFFGARVPFMKATGKDKESAFGHWLENHVEGMLQRVKHPMFTIDEPEDHKDHNPFNVFETHKSVIARVPVAENIHPKTLGVLIGPHRLTLNGLPKNSKTVIPLPSPVVQQGSRATLKDGILEIRMLKQIQTEQDKEIHIRLL